jgi:hypothetical protein
MPFFHLFRKRSLAVAWRFTTKGVIWRICPASGRMLIGEERDLESKSTSFFCVDSSGTVRWRERSFTEAWWTGIEAVHEGVLYVHRYATPDLPSHKGITAVDCASGETLWAIPDALFVGARGERVLAWQNSARGACMLEIEHRSGELLSARAQSESEVPLSLPEQEGSALLKSPVPLTESDVQHAALRGLLQKSCAAGTVPSGVEYCERGAVVVFTYTVSAAAGGSSPQVYTSRLCVAERESGRVLFECTIERAAPSPGAAMFMLYDDMLYVVCERRTLCAVALP